MASYVCRRGKNKPHVVQWYTSEVDETGKLRRVRKTASFTTKLAAEEFQGKLVDEQQAHRYGVHNPSSALLYIDHCRDFLRRQQKRRDYAYPSYVADESKIRRYWLEKFGGRLISTITREEILVHLDWLEFEVGLSPATRNRHLQLMRSLFEDALERGKIKANPTLGIKKKEEVKTKPRTNFASEAQFDAYLAGMYTEGKVYGIFADLQAGTGSRICTANAIQWRDIDEEAGTVTLRRIEERAGGSKIVPRIKGKSATHDDLGAHVMPLLPHLRQVLIAWRRESRFTRPTDFIAANQETGKYVPYDTLKGVIARVVEKTGIDPITSHAVRRYFTKSLKLAGFSRAEIVEIVGWSSEAMVALYDSKDVGHLADKMARLGFGAARKSNVVPMAKSDCYGTAGAMRKRRT